MSSARASIHFFLVKSIERLVELCGRRDAALKKRCQETLGEWSRLEVALRWFFPPFP